MSIYFQRAAHTVIGLEVWPVTQYTNSALSVVIMRPFWRLNLEGTLQETWQTLVI